MNEVEALARMLCDCDEPCDIHLSDAENIIQGLAERGVFVVSTDGIASLSRSIKSASDPEVVNKR